VCAAGGPSGMTAGSALPLASRSSLGSFHMCRAASCGSSQLGTSSTVGLSKLQQATSASSDDFRSASTAAAAAAVAVAAGARAAPQRNAGSWYVRKEPAMAGPAPLVTGSPVADTDMAQGQRRVLTASVLAPLTELDAAVPLIQQGQRPAAAPAAAVAVAAAQGSWVPGSSGVGAPRVPAASLVAGVQGRAGGSAVGGVVHTGGSAGSAASSGSSKLSQLQAPQSKHIQDLW
jgi:hypothetical protein